MMENPQPPKGGVSHNGESRLTLKEIHNYFPELDDAITAFANHLVRMHVAALMISRIARQ